METKVDLKNPYIVKWNNPSDFITELKKQFPDATEYNSTDILKQNGYDWIKYKHRDDDIWNIVVAFDPKSIKINKKSLPPLPKKWLPRLWKETLEQNITINPVGEYDNWIKKTKLFNFDPQKDPSFFDLEAKANSLWWDNWTAVKTMKKFLLDNKNETIELYHWTFWWHDIVNQWLKATKNSTKRSIQSQPWYTYLSYDPSRARTFWEMWYPWKEIKVYKVSVPIKDLVADADQLWNKRLRWDKKDIWNTLADSFVYWWWARIKWNIEPYKIKLFEDQKPLPPIPKKWK